MIIIKHDKTGKIVFTRPTKEQIIKMATEVKK